MGEGMRGISNGRDGEGRRVGGIGVRLGRWNGKIQRSGV